jgi:UPF0271 protein
MTTIDLNCDMGESFGAWKMGNDAAIMPYISSANIACGFHAGDPTTIARTVSHAIEHRVAVGAHPSYPDLQGFGRRAMSLSLKEVHDIIIYQVSAVKGICETLGGRLHHVKPHGALYNQAARDEELAAAIADAVYSVDGGLFFYGLSGSFLVSEAEKAGLRTASEVFADRGYMDDGSLAPRNRADALVHDSTEAASRASAMAVTGEVSSVAGNSVRVRAETICIHGDGAHALQFAESISSALSASGIEIKAP